MFGAAGVASLLAPHEAHAAVSILMSLDELCGHSARVVLAEPVERTSRWEELAGGRRIVTSTRLVVEETLAGEPESEVWVRTLGGRVDKIGQHVAGEATFTIGERSVVFLERAGEATVVTGMAQGHYRLAEKEGEVVLRPSPDAGTLLPRRGPAVAAREILVGARLAKATDAIREAWKRRGAK